MGTYRLILAILVALSHIGITFLGMNPGVSAVISFFLISGYVMTALISQYYEKSAEIPHFYLDRILRLFPQYLFYAALALSAMWIFNIENERYWKDLDLTSIILNLAMLPTGFYMLGLESALIIPPAWSLGLEVSFYILIPLLLIYKARNLAFCASIVVFICAYLGILNTNYFGYRLLPGTLFMFILGSYLMCSGPKERKLNLIAYVGCIALLINTLFFSQYTFRYNIEVLLGIVIGLPLVGLLSKMKRTKWDDALGNLSYGVFLNHYLIRTLMINAEIDIRSATGLTIYLGTSLVLAYITFMFIERPVIDLRRRYRMKQKVVAEKAISIGQTN